MTTARTSSFSLRTQIFGLVVWLGAAFIVAGVGSAASINAGSFYTVLDRPTWAPPAWIFGPVWTVLYAMMGVAAWLVWRGGGFHASRGPLTLFVAQLVVNGLWSWLFFAWRLGAWSFLDIAVLWVLIVATLIAFWRIRAAAGILLIPYLMWVSYAAALNYTLWKNNPGIL